MRKYRRNHQNHKNLTWKSLGNHKHLQIRNHMWIFKKSSKSSKFFGIHLEILNLLTHIRTYKKQHQNQLSALAVSHAGRPCHMQAEPVRPSRRTMPTKAIIARRPWASSERGREGDGDDAGGRWLCWWLTMITKTSFWRRVALYTGSVLKLRPYNSFSCRHGGGGPKRPKHPKLVHKNRLVLVV